MSELDPGWFVYILECRSGKLYTGMTTNLLRCWAEHVRGGSRFTNGDAPVQVIHVEVFDQKSDPARRERRLKGWTRAKKLALAFDWRTIPVMHSGVSLDDVHAVLLRAERVLAHLNAHQTTRAL